MNYLADKLSEIALLHEDQEFGTKKAAVSQSLMYFCETGCFNREQVNSIVSKKVVLPTLEGWQLSFFQVSFIREASGLKHLRSLNRCDTSFSLGPEQESIQRHIITEYEKWCLLFKYMKDSSLHSRKFAAEGGQFVEQVNQETQAVMMGASSSCVEDFLRIQSTRGEELIVFVIIQAKLNKGESFPLWNEVPSDRPSSLGCVLHLLNS